MCKASSLLDDPTSVNDYLEFIRTWMNDTTSIVALSIKSGRVIGVAVTRVNSKPEKTDTYQRVQVLLRSIHRYIDRLLKRVAFSTRAETKFISLLDK